MRSACAACELKKRTQPSRPGERVVSQSNFMRAPNNGDEGKCARRNRVPSVRNPTQNITSSPGAYCTVVGRPVLRCNGSEQQGLNLGNADQLAATGMPRACVKASQTAAPRPMSQRSFASAEYAMNKKRTRREKFLSETERVVPWTRLIEAIKPPTRAW